MEWATVQHLDLRHVGRGLKPLQPHTAAFHPSQAIIAAAIGTYIIEFDALTGSKIASIDIGAPVVRMAYSPTSGHTVVAVLEDCTIRSCDFDMEQTSVLHSPEKRTEQISSDTEVHLALTPLQPVVFFGFHRRMSVTVVGTVEGGRAPTKIKTDLKKPIVNLACHPRLPVLYVAYADGLIRAYNIQTYAVLYTLQLDQTIKLIGAGAFAFHPMLEWIFVGDRRGTLLAWDVSTERPNMIGINMANLMAVMEDEQIIALCRHLSLVGQETQKDGVLQVWKTRVSVNPHRQPLQANFFEPAVGGRRKGRKKEKGDVCIKSSFGGKIALSRNRDWGDTGNGKQKKVFLGHLAAETNSLAIQSSSRAYSIAIETIDVTRILTLQDGEAVYPLPRIKSLIVHPKLNLATLLFAVKYTAACKLHFQISLDNVASGDIRNRAAFTREGRKQLFAVLQSAKGSTATVLKEKLSSLGSSGILADHQLQTKLQEHHLKG
ncbi:hypothetical protein ACLOJK_013612 [Asimina triloba]